MYTRKTSFAAALRVYNFPCSRIHAIDGGIELSFSRLNLVKAQMKRIGPESPKKMKPKKSGCREKDKMALSREISEGARETKKSN